MDIKTGKGLDNVFFDFRNSDGTVKTISGQMNISMKGGENDDHLGLIMGQVQPGAVVNVSAKMEAGNDTVATTLLGNVLGTLGVQAQGDSGRDTLRVLSRRGGWMMPGTVDLKLNGGADVDTTAVELIGTLNGRLLINATGGTGGQTGWQRIGRRWIYFGNDNTAVRLTSTPNSLGSVNVHVWESQADNENDIQELQLNLTPFVRRELARVDGGGGTDTAYVRGFLDVVNVENRVNI
jgi:hypothetical protein